MARRRKRGPRVPEALLRVYGGLVQTLEAAILSLLPPPPACLNECACGGRRCLGCCSLDYLLRKDDPPDYRVLLTQAFCVVPRDAPPPPGVFISDNVPQRTVVRNLMVLIADDVHNHFNVLQTDHKKEIHCSSTGEFLCTPIWELLLSRIGSQLMIFLLRFSSIFVPVQGKSHYQITGHRMDSVFKKTKISNMKSLSSNQKIFKSVHTMVHLSNKLKRKRDCNNGSSYVKAAAPHDLDCSSNHFSIKVDRTSSSAYFTRVNDITNNIQFDGKQLSMRVVCDAGRSQKMSPDGKPVLHDSVLRPDYHGVHLENIKLPCTEYEYGQIGSFSTNSPTKSSAVSSSKGSKRHRRLFSWQRRRKKKVSEKQLSGEWDKENLKMELLELDCNCHQSLQQPETATLLESTGVGALEDSKVSSLETIEEISSKNCQIERTHMILQGNKTISTKKPQKRRAVTNDVFERQYVLLQNSSNQPQPQHLGVPPHVKAMCDNRMTSNPLQKDFGCSNSKKIGPMCFYCLMMLSPQRVETRDQIKRSGIFYNTHLPYSVFPRDHILNSLKPNNSGAVQLMKHIFGFPDGSKNFLACKLGGCSMNSHCLKKLKLELLTFSISDSVLMRAQTGPYHTLLHLLKSLIRNAGRCQRDTLLHKHCIETTKLFNHNINKKIENPKKKMKKGQQSSQEVPIVPNFASSCCPSVADSQSSSVMNKESVVSREASFHMRNEKSQLSDLHQGVRDPDFELIESYSKHQHVVSFIWAVCRSIVPISLLGNSSSWRSLQKIISKFVKLHRLDNLHLRQCVHGVKISCYPFLSAVKSSYCFCDNESKSVSNERITRNAMKTDRAKSILLSNLFLRWIYWFFSEMVVPIITANFYVTDRECRKHELFYYPKPIWRKLVHKTISSLEGKKFQLLDEASVKHILSGRSFGFSKVRFLPKDKCLRILALHGAPSVLYFSTQDSYSSSCCRGIKQKAKHQKYNSCGEIPVQYQSVNSAFEDVYAILKSVKVEKPEMLGSSVFDNNDVYQKIHQFLFNIKSRSSEMPEIFIVVADVSKAFDSIDHDKLIGILPEIFENEYVLSKHAKLSCWNKSVKIFYDYTLCESGTRTSFFSPSVQLYQSSNIIINQGNFRKIRKEELLHLLQEHVKRSIFKIGRCFYLQKVGISQGSVLSTLLCSYYFGHMEKSLILPHLESNNKASSKHASDISRMVLSSNDELSNITDFGKKNFHHLDHHASEPNPLVVGMEGSITGDNLLLRLIDDFLFISTSKEQATRFIVEMKKGLMLYNCVMNEKKSGANFDMTENGFLINRVYTGADGISFLPWCGLLVNCQTLEIQADYTRYCDIDIRSTLTIKMDSKPCHNLKKKLFSIVRIRCHPIFYDSGINSPAIVSLNAYQTFLLCAMKFHCCVHNMKNITKLSPSYLVAIIERSLSYMFKHIKKLMHGMFRRCGIRPSLALQKREIVWLGLSAYICVLKKKHSQYHILLSLLRSRIAQYGCLADALSHLRYAVDESHSSCFSKMKF